MNDPLLRPLPTATVLLLSLPAFAQAHPGHSALDSFSAAPHLGHEQEYAIIVIALALIALGFSAYWLASRRR